MRTKIRNISGCYGFTIPKTICENFGVKFGDVYNLKIDKNRILLNKIKKKTKKLSDKELDKIIEEAIEEVEREK